MNTLAERGLAFLRDLARVNTSSGFKRPMTMGELISVKLLIIEIELNFHLGSWGKSRFIEYWREHLTTIKKMLPQHDHPEVGSFLWRFAELNDEVEAEIATWNSVSDQLHNF